MWKMWWLLWMWLEEVRWGWCSMVMGFCSVVWCGVVFVLLDN